jgi:hypothetical protein
MLAALEEAGVGLYSNVSPSNDHSLNAGMPGVHYTMFFGKDEAWVEFVQNGAKERNKELSPC